LVVKVPLFNQKTEEEKQEERRAKAEQEARARYLASPVGKAEAAFQAGQMFFQLTINISEIEGRSSDWSYSQSTRTRRFNAVDTLGQIEEMGWHLEHVGYVFVETGEIARSKVMSSGSVARTQGYVEGIYLFRRSGQLLNTQSGTQQGTAEPGHRQDRSAVARPAGWPL
jgi:hypothetical protein